MDFVSPENGLVDIWAYATASTAENTEFEFLNMQLEYGDTPSSYVEHESSEAFIAWDEGNCVYDDSGNIVAQDTYKTDTGKCIKATKKLSNISSGTTINYADMPTDGWYNAYAADGTVEIGQKGATLGIAAATLIYQLATPIVTDIPKQKLEVFENGTVYVEPIGDASESTLPSVEMTIPTGTSNKFGVASHDYDRAAADWTLTNSESKCFMLAVSNAGGAANIIAPNRPGTMYAISNASEYTITIKISGGNGVDVNTGKKVLVIHDGTDYTALTAEL